MRTLKIDDNGDILFDNLGKVKLISSLDLVAQSLNLRIKTEKGELIYNDEWGRPIFKGKINKENLLIFLNETLLDDVRVSKIEIINFNIINNSIFAGIKITLNTNEILDLNIKI